MRNKKSIIIALLAVLLFVGVGVGSIQANTSAASNTRVVKDNKGKKVTIPKKVKRVADLWHANNPILLMLGGEKDLVATTQLIHDNKLLTKLYPSVKKQAVPFNGDSINTEELIAQKPDVVIGSDPAQIETIRKAGIPAVNSMFQDYKGMKKTVTLTGNILGGKAVKNAKIYNQQLTDDIEEVGNLTRGAGTPSVLHIVNKSDLTKVDGRKTIVDQWIKTAGGKNAIKSKGNMISVSAEEIIKSNPDIIIVGNTTSKKALKALKKDSRFKSLKAVKHNKVYGNPTCIFQWDRYSVESDLQLWWAASKIHPSEMKDFSVEQKTAAFYQAYFNHKFSKKQIKQILNGEVLK
ncbi:ABC transporter substrate-binding protein [Companilactobacillus ginsenosidimutans]|uniref:Peptide ABC transporter substrate-binding protein n=1 Tax=Companilactobacillus ginsenosidimutans TaxID=1007676 RepID=A0A0H4QMA4_9LACO|nr:ABC transporter substrate-binding protein [Companilactobacillus ginsenosidimutans]AKP67838.1 peptide ABC transporter substrate-binding protein [Companilactobacillus ginsenosidimutans]